MSTVKVKWYASDGYVGGSRPQEARIDVSDFVGLSPLEAEKLFGELMEQAFLEKVSWSCADYDGSLSEIMEAAAKMADEE